MKQRFRISDYACPDCGAQPGMPCRSRIRRGRASTCYHPDRRLAWQLHAVTRGLRALGGSP